LEVSEGEFVVRTLASPKRNLDGMIETCAVRQNESSKRKESVSANLGKAERTCSPSRELQQPPDDFGRWMYKEGLRARKRMSEQEMKKKNTKETLKMKAKKKMSP
jgi:hypothetical protein